MNSESTARVTFWMMFAIGTLMVAFVWLLAQVPGPPLNTRLCYMIWSSVAGLMLGSILLGRRIWKPEKGPVTVMNIVQGIAWVELCVAAAALVATVSSRR
jgi:hypothetical protein